MIGINLLLLLVSLAMGVLGATLLLNMREANRLIRWLKGDLLFAQDQARIARERAGAAEARLAEVEASPAYMLGRQVIESGWKMVTPEGES